jgi:hypothetical protein
MREVGKLRTLRETTSELALPFLLNEAGRQICGTRAFYLFGGTY